MQINNTDSQSFGMSTAVSKRALADLGQTSRKSFLELINDMQPTLDYFSRGTLAKIKPIADSNGVIEGAEMSARPPKMTFTSFIDTTIDSLKEYPLLTRTIHAQNGKILERDLINASFEISENCRNMFDIKA